MWRMKRILTLIRLGEVLESRRFTQFGVHLKLLIKFQYVYAMGAPAASARASSATIVAIIQLDDSLESAG
jgi:hypothetical protein